MTRIAHIRSLYGIEREFDRYYMRLKAKLNCRMHLHSDRDMIKLGISKALLSKQENDKSKSSVDGFMRVERSQNELMLKLSNKNE